MGDFNTEVTQTSMKVFCDSYEFKNLIKDATCYKNPENPSCIDLILTNNPNSFQNSGVIETGLSDFHKMTVTVMKTTFEKLKPNIIHYRDYRKFSNDKFRENLISRLPTENIRVDVNIINRETIPYHFYEKQKLTIMRTWIKKILLIISTFGEL